MTTPTNHYLTITLPDGKHVHERVIYLQPKSERWREQSATVHIICAEWLEPYWHVATYLAGDKSYQGKFMPLRYKMDESNDWRFEGSFESEESTVVAE